MKKVSVSYRIDPGVLELLKLICSKESRSQTNMFEQLIKEKAKKEKITLEKENPAK